MHVHVLEHGVVVSILHVRRVPIDETTCPVYGSLAVGRETCRPEGKHDPGRRLGVIVAVGGGIPRVGTFLRAHGLAVDDPVQFVGGPVYRVGMFCGDCVGNGDVGSIVVCAGLLVRTRGRRGSTTNS